MTATVTRKILERIILVNLSYRAWLGEVSDRTLARDVERWKNMKEGQARTSVSLIPEEFRVPLVSAKSALRGYWYANTVPYGHKTGWAMVPVEKYQTIVDRIATIKRTMFDPAVERFIDASDDIRREAAADLGDAFDRERFDSMFPTGDELRSRYDVDVDVRAFSDPDHLLISGIGESEIADMQAAEMERQAKHVSEGMKKVAIAFRDLVRTVAARVKSDPKTVKYKGLFASLDEMLEALPTLNILRDKEFDRIIRTTREKIGSLDPDSIREHEGTRKQVETAAGEIANDLDAFCSSL